MSAGAQWQEANQRYLLAALAVVGAALDRHAARSVGSGPATGRAPGQDEDRAGEGRAGQDRAAQDGQGRPGERRRESGPAGEERAAAALAAAAAAMPAPPALEVVRERFGLSAFELDVLLLCAGVELDSELAARCAAAQGESRGGRRQPTWSLALAALPEAHWSATTPGAPLRLWRLIEAGHGEGLTASPLRIDERVLHFLAGVETCDDRLSGLVKPVTAGVELSASQQDLARRAAVAWPEAAGGGGLPVLQLCGGDAAGRRSLALAICSRLGLRLQALPAAAVPTAPAELEGLIRLWERESALSGSALLLDAAEPDPAEAARESAVAALIEGLRGPLVVAVAERRPARQRPVLAFDVPQPSWEERRGLWLAALEPAAAAALDGQLDAVVTQFQLGAAAIRSAAAQLRGAREETGSSAAAAADAADAAEAAEAAGTAGTGEAAGIGEIAGTGTAAAAAVLWDACRAQGRPRLDSLAQRLEPAAGWDDLVLPDGQLRTLREIAIHVRRRRTVHEDWGFAARGSRGLGIGALFAGPSGTGKTMAAEVLAAELRLDLYRIDLSGVVSKYIGETEKNLRRVFDAAEQGGAILLFDEADALFGKRSEVKDSHDRYANIEVSYLLQRMEAYRGLAILTSNSKDALDTAFLRRLRFVVHFPFPDAAQRAEIWRRVFPPQTPTAGLDAAKLARLGVAGGNIRNIALAAAFLAADEGAPVRMSHLLRAARGELAKLERPLADAEVRGWAE